MTTLYELLIPLIAADPSDKWPKIVPKQIHRQQTITPSQDPAPTWSIIPKTGEIYLIYSMTAGWARYSADDTIIPPTTNVYFEHWHEPHLLKHQNYMLHSFIDHPEECWIEVEEASALQYQFSNTLNVSIYFDITIWLFVMKKGEWPVVREYLRRALKKENMENNKK